MKPYKYRKIIQMQMKQCIYKRNDTRDYRVPKIRSPSVSKSRTDIRRLRLTDDPDGRHRSEYPGGKSLETFESFRSRDDAHEFDLFSAMLLDEIYGSNCRTTGLHRVKSYDQSLVDRIREFAVIFMWLVGYMITVKSDVADLCGWN